MQYYVLLLSYRLIRFIPFFWGGNFHFLFFIFFTCKFQRVPALHFLQMVRFVGTDGRTNCRSNNTVGTHIAFMFIFYLPYIVIFILVCMTVSDYLLSYI